MDAYDDFPYESIAFPETHPNHLAILGWLLGLATADPDTARVLELGCAGGGNLIPLAWGLPKAVCLGIDLSARQIALGQAQIAGLGLTNLALRQGNILDLDASLGTFDYIIAHGVYSWVPEPVRRHLLRLACQLLSPTGVFYVSYNCLPGWRMRGMLRDILLYACREAEGPMARLTAARAALERLRQALPGLDALSARYLLAEIASLDQSHPSYLLFEYLAEENRAFLFSEFTAEAEAAGLRYLCDTDPRTLFPSTYGAAVDQALAPIEDGLDLEQWLDFVTNRNFRQSLLCRADAPLPEEIAFDLERFAGLAFRADLRPTVRPELRRVKDSPFLTVAGKRLTISQPLTKALVLELGARFPDSLTLEEVLPAAMCQVEAAGGGALARELDACLAELFSLFAHQAIGARPSPRRLPRPALERPRVWPLAQAQVASGARRVTTPNHSNLDLDAFAARLIVYLDGTRTPAEIAEAMTVDLLQGRLAPPKELATRQWRPEQLLARTRPAVDELIALFARQGILLPSPPGGTA
jgi:SAM-dependent methyltransferase/methyltransferase-like protein